MCWTQSSKRPRMKDIETMIGLLSSKANDQCPCDNTFLNSDISEVRQTHKRSGENWNAAFNPTAQNITELKDLLKIPNSSPVSCVRFSSEGRIIAIAGAASIQLIDIVKNKHIRTVGHPKLYFLSDVCFSSDDKYLAAAGECLPQSSRKSSLHYTRKGCCFVWSTESFTCLHVFEKHEQEVNAVTFSKDSRLVATGSSDCTVRLWDIRSGESRLFRMTDAIKEGVDASITSIALSPDGNLLAAGCFDEVIRLWNVNTGDYVGQLGGHSDAVYCVTFSIDERYLKLFSGSLDKSIKCWNIGGPSKLSSERSKAAGWFCKFTRSGHEREILGLTQSVCGKWLASCSPDQRIIFWEAENGHAQFVINTKDLGSVKSVSMTNGKQGGILAAVTGENEVQIWTFAFKQFSA
ncbi:WD40 repeat-like protein [Schizopora paradoxa]|uniref:WD40 repeat-like protein n=1 Tax=Schizopora paradoxa TaxID=27342 RepID=A0A0H2RQ21_9AGAM|nr:WD40 repeat-like protein [Schizopora paradoxa]